MGINNRQKYQQKERLINNIKTMSKQLEMIVHCLEDIVTEGISVNVNIIGDERE